MLQKQYFTAKIGFPASKKKNKTFKNVTLADILSSQTVDFVQELRRYSILPMSLNLVEDE